MEEMEVSPPAETMQIHEIVICLCFVESLLASVVPQKLSSLNSLLTAASTTHYVKTKTKYQRKE